MGRGLNQPGLQRQLSPFHFPVAAHTQANQVRQFVGLQVVLVFAWDVVKGLERYNVVNIKLFAILLASPATHLADVLVALARKALLFRPVGAVVLDVPALPVRGRWAGKEFAHPFVLARLAAKVHFARFGSYPGLVAFNRCSTRSAFGLDWFLPVRIRIPAHVNLAPFIPTVSATEEMIIALNLPAITLDPLAALRALDLNRRALFMRGGVFSRLRGLPRATTGVVAEVSLVTVRPARLTQQFLAAPVALNRNVVYLRHSGAGLRTIAALADLTRQYLKKLSASLAGNQGALLSVRVVDSTLLSRPALNRTVIRSLDRRQRAINLFAAVVALNQFALAFGGQKKTSCRLVSWNACRGRATADRRQGKLYHFGLPTSNCNTLDMGNYTTAGRWGQCQVA